MRISDVVRHCKSLSFYKLQDFAGENFTIVYDYIKSTSDANPNKLLVPTIFTCIATDGKLSEREWDFIAQFIGGYSYDEAFATAEEFFNYEAQEMVQKLADLFPGSIREAYVKMCIAVMTVDNRVSDEELVFLETLLNY
jgi:hypothetical protein